MTAAASAAKVSQTPVDDPTAARQPALVLALVVGGGLVEGVALGSLQSFGLSHLLPALDRWRWALVTTAVAGLGWAAASAPPVLSGDDGGSAPPLLLVVLGAMGLGAVMGTLLGAAQATGLRGLVSHPSRWVSASAAAWAPAMAVIFVGASSPGSDWSLPFVAGLGTVTGSAAGALLGLVSWPFLDALSGPAVHDRLVVKLLGSRAQAVLGGSVCVLRVRGRRSGRTLEFPVQYASTRTEAVIVPGRPKTKQWWCNLLEPAAVELLVRGRWQQGSARVLHRGDAGYADAVALYRLRWPRVRLPDGAPVVWVRFATVPPAAADA
jgi:hypothetical protein